MQRAIRSELSAALLGALLLAMPARGDVIVVDSTGLGDFTALPAAVAAADDGDVLLVRPGLYGDFGVGGSKSLSVVADGGPVTILGAVIVRDTLPGTRIVLSGLTASGVTDPKHLNRGNAFIAVNNAGDVRVQDCSFTGADGDENGWTWEYTSFSFEITGHVAGWPGAFLLDNSGSIAFNACTFEGGRSVDVYTWDVGASDSCGCSYGSPGGDGATVGNSSVAFYDCSLTGGLGGHSDNNAGDGGAGLAVSGGDVVVAGSVAVGGDGGNSLDAITGGHSGDGGDGLHVDAPGQLRILDTASSGGAAGFAFGRPPGLPGEGLGGDGSVTSFAGTARSLAAPGAVFTDGPVSVSLSGTPGDLALLFISPGPGWLPVAEYGGQVLVQFPATGLILGSVPPSGEIVLAGTIPPIAPLEHVSIHLQAVMGTVSDAALTGHAVLVVIDGAFQ